MVLQLWPVYWYSGAYTGMITIEECARLGSIAHQLTEQLKVTTALLDNALPVPGLIPLQGIPAVIGALDSQRFFDEMPEAETKAERVLYPRYRWRGLWACWCAAPVEILANVGTVSPSSLCRSWTPA